MRKLIIKIIFNKRERALIKEALNDLRFAKLNAMSETLQDDANHILLIKKHFDTDFNLYQ